MFNPLMDTIENAGTKRKAAKEEEEESSRVDAVQNSKQNKKRARMDPFAGMSSSY